MVKIFTQETVVIPFTLKELLKCRLLTVRILVPY